MPKNTVKLEGLKELYALMDGIPVKAKAKTMQRIGKDVLRKTMKNTLESKYKRMSKVGNEKGNPAGALFGFISKYNFLNWFEYGTDLRKRDSGGKTGKMNAKPFWTPHLNRNVNTTIKTYFEVYNDLITDFIKRKKR